ncbi:vWA domain-containing protein [Vreelandella sedimenti]|uniref:vWA domain-containing protein n=1 Tax=Vreelandella sedimenti TaxID=2729618 RepID=UPI00257CB749|nr:VWA domain-containing protein [Halomonas sp. UBA3173]|tara:strand:+ start:73419 stop:74708 length:1290 start_codon:yes stop_codon:yes gene_type:complete
MQRILRDSQERLGGTFESYQSKVALIHRHFPPSIGNMFAMPRNGQGDTLEWWTELPGQPIRFDALDEEQQAALLERYQQRQQSLGHLADELIRRGDSDGGKSLKTLVGPADEHHLYSLNGEPVVIRWGAEKVKATASDFIPQSVPIASTVAPVTSSSRRSFRSLMWLLPVLLLFFLGWLLYLFWPLDRFWSDGLTNASEKEVVPYACREEGSLPPEFVMIFDTSGSMNINIAATQEDEDWYFSMTELHMMLLRNMGNERLRTLETGTSRLEVAKDAISGIINQLHSDIDTGLITYAGCGAPVKQGVFSGSQREQLIDGIKALNAYDGTPLAASLVSAAEMVDGRERDAVIIAFVDGTDGCEQDQCQVVANIIKKQPRITINVVDVTTGGLSNCLAEQTGGQVFSSKNADEIARMMEQASSQMLNASHCE